MTGSAAGYEIAMGYLLYFLLPVTVVFTVFFVGAIVMFTALLLGWKRYVGDRKYVL